MTLRALLGLVAVLACTACAERDGLVEVAWQFDDVRLHRIYPVGDLPDTCDLDSQNGIKYDLRVRLTIVENSDACVTETTNPECQVIEPLLFPCDRFRGTAKHVPISQADDLTDPGYLMVVEAVIDPTDTPPFVPDPSCLAAAGPRVRRVKPGRITDLEVYQFIVLGLEIGGPLLDIDLCRPAQSGGDGDPGTSTDTGTGTDSTT